MPEQRQELVENGSATTRALPGTIPAISNVNNLRAAFPDSPIHRGDLTDKERKEAYQSLSLSGNVEDDNTIAGKTVKGGPGLGVSSYNRDFKGTAQNPVPNLNDVETGGGGLPATPYIPNLASPGPGSVNASDQPVYTGDLPDTSLNSEFGSGLGGLVSPHETTPKIASQELLGTFISGRSFLGSDGKA